MDKRSDIIAAMLSLERIGMNRGSSGNVSIRDGDHLLVTPSGVPPSDITPEMIARIPLEGDGRSQGPLAPSVEWRFHREILRTRPEMGAVVHAHAPWCTVLACARKPIPAVHYMIAAFGGTDIPVADYATYGSAELSANVLRAMQGRAGCLMANHGMVVAGDTIARAMWLAEEIEALAHQYYHTLAIGGPAVLTEAEIADTARGFASYGKRSEGKVDA